MHSLLHSLHIGTLATWLSVVGFGTVGVVIHGKSPLPTRPKIAETQVIAEDFTIGVDSSPDATEPETATPVPAEPLPAPPELPTLAEIEPLPVVPDFAPRAEAPATAPAQPRPTPSPRVGSPTRAAGLPAGRTAAATQKGGGKPGSGVAGMSTSARLAAGRMPSPTYPPFSRRNGQSGTVIVEFTVDSTGRVISAFAKSPTPYPLLNAEAVSTVRSWTFPPGAVMKLQRPIVFQLR